MIRINNLDVAKNFAKQSNAKLVQGYSVKRENNSEECTVLFEGSKQLSCFFNRKVNGQPQKIDPKNLLQKRNITLWNKIDRIDSSFQRAVLTSLYLFSSIILLPVADWVIGNLRSDQEIMSVYNKNTNPSNLQKSAITKHQRVVSNGMITCKYKSGKDLTTMEYNRVGDNGSFHTYRQEFSHRNKLLHCGVDRTNRESLRRFEDENAEFFPNRIPGVFGISV